MKFVCVGLLWVCFAVGRSRVAEAADSDLAHQADWMRRIDDDVRLSQISIPGTHDSCALYADQPRGPGARNWLLDSPLVAAPFTITQTMSLDDQLNAGCRYFDIRCRANGDSLDIHHGHFFQHITLTQVCQTLDRFLVQHPSECIVMRLSSESRPTPGSKSEAELLHAALSSQRVEGRSFSSMFALHRVAPQIMIPKLGDVRGKVVVIQLGFDLGEYRGAIDRQSLSMEDHYSIISGGTGDRVPPGTPAHQSTLPQKSRLVIEQLSRAASIDPDRQLSLTHASGGYPTRIQVVAEATNQAVQHFVTRHDRPHAAIGIVAMDFPTPELIRAIIETNPGLAE